MAADEIDETENGFCANGDCLLSVRDSDSTKELFNSFAMFYYINGRLLYTAGQLFVSDEEMPPGIGGEKLNLKELCKNFSNKIKWSCFCTIPMHFALVLCGERRLSNKIPHRTIQKSYGRSPILRPQLRVQI